MVEEEPGDREQPCLNSQTLTCVCPGVPHLGVQLMDQVRHRLPVQVSCVRAQRRVDVGVGIDPDDAQLPDGCRVAVDGTDGQTEGGSGETVTSSLTWTHLSVKAMVHS